MPDLTLINRPVVLSAGTSAATLTDILGRIEGITGRASIYGVDDPVLAKLFGSESIEAVFRSSYYRDGFVHAAAPEFLEDWTHSRVGAGTALTDAGWITDFATGVPRITDKGLLIEGSAINYMKFFSLNVAQFVASGFPNGEITDATEPATVPRAGLAWIALNNTASLNAFAYQTETLTENTQYTISCLVETPDSTPPVPSNDSSSGDFRFVIGGTIPILTFRIEPMRGRVWRVIGTGTIGTGLDAFSGIQRLTGHSLQAARALKFSGFQLEARPIASSPIITTGATATRGEDVSRFAFVPGNAFTLFAECDMPPAGGDFRAMLSLTALEIGNRVTLGRYADGTMLAQVVADEVPYGLEGAELPGAQRIRAAVVVRDDSVTACFNGGTVLTTPAPRPLGLERLWPGTVGGTGNTELGGYIRRVMTFDRAMTDAQLQAMTTL